MSPTTERVTKSLTLAFLFGMFMFSFMIRAGLSIVAPTLIKLYHITPAQMGYVLSGWNWSYTGALTFAGVIVDWIGPWASVGIGSVVWGVSTVMLPIAVGIASLFAMRFVFGLGQGVLLPSIATSVSRIFGLKERAKAIAIAFSGNNVGAAIAAPIGAFLVLRFGWPAVFYVMGGGSLLLTLAWFLLYPDKSIGRQPVAQPAGAATPAQEHIPWRSLFRYRSTWGIALGQFGYLYAYFFFVSWLPGILILERKMTLLKTGIYASLPFWAGMIGTLFGGWLSDHLIHRGISHTASRKSLIAFGLCGATILVIASAYAAQAWLAVALLTLCVGSLRLATGPANSLPIDLAPRSVVGSVTAIQNFFGNVGGLLAPILTGYLYAATHSFFSSLLVAGGMAVLGAVGFCFVVGNLERDRIEPSRVRAVPLTSQGAFPGAE